MTVTAHLKTENVRVDSRHRCLSLRRLDLPGQLQALSSVFCLVLGVETVA